MKYRLPLRKRVYFRYLALKEFVGAIRCAIFGHCEHPDCDAIYCTRCHKWQEKGVWSYVD